MKCSAYVATSLDGYIARTDGSLDWLPRPVEGGAAEDYGYAAFMDSVDVLVVGRRTFDTVAGFTPWPYAGKRVVVLSRSLRAAPAALASHGIAFHAGPVAALAAALRADGLRHAYVDGGKVVQAFLGAGLLDELTITRVPVLLGAGIPLFGPLAADITLEHLDTRAWPDGLVQSRYRAPR
jgi:dihydrofolate reductase